MSEATTLTISKQERIERELEAVRAASADGLLHPDKAVEWAKANPASALHGEIEWDDAKAAAAHRVDQVRQIIRVVVTTNPQTRVTARVYVSVPTDRHGGGGYQRTDDALLRARQELVNEALKTVMTLSNRYTHLPELQPLFAAIDDAVRAFAEKMATRAA